jgi:hypothetical protein
VRAGHVGLDVVDELGPPRRPDSCPNGQVKHDVAAAYGVVDLVIGQVPAHWGEQAIPACGSEVLVGDGVLTEPATIQADHLHAAGDKRVDQM